jgi:hypothetical protein
VSNLKTSFKTAKSRIEHNPQMNRAPVRGPERYACVSEERRPLLRGLLHHGLRTAQLQPLFAAAGNESDSSAEQRHNDDLAGVHGVTSNYHN